MQVFDIQLNDYDDTYSNGVSNSSVDAAFRKINKNTTAFHIWRVESMSVTSLSKDQYGSFSDNDCYIVFSASQYGHLSGVDTVSREVRGSPMEYHVHFWLGALASPEKSGVAAYKTVELDNLLNGLITQHRETQGNESSRFKSYFKSGIRILKSNSIPTQLPKLYKVKGKRCPIVMEIDNITWSSFTSEDIFLLHTPKIVFIWVGRSSNTIEKQHATKVALEIKEQFKVQNVAFVDDGYEKTLDDDLKKEFNKYLPLDKRHVLPENNAEEQEKRSSYVRLYRCSENDGKYRVTEMKSGPLEQTDLDQEDVYILDQGTQGIWVWVGKQASDKERSEALRNARGFVKKKKYPNYTKVTRVVDGNEPIEFKMLFSSWKSDPKCNKKGITSTLLVTKFDAESMEERPALAAETQLVDDGSGNVTLWRIKQNNIIEIPKERHGYFFSGDCYIILYTYQISNTEKNLLYYWLGSHATQEDINCATMKTAEIDAELGHLGFQARVIQGYEPAHFLQLFKGKLVIFRGRGTDYDESGKNLKHPSQYLLQIYGSTKYSSKGVQVQPRSSVLNSNYCFVLRRGKHGHIWCGNYSTGDQREMAKLFAGKDFQLILEGQDNFFSLLGGKAPYFTKLIKKDEDPKLPRLFYCSSSNGKFKDEEIFFFTQQDLIPEDVMLLDAYHTMYIWIGKLSTKENQRMSLKTAMEYLQADPSGRDMNIPVIQIKQGLEPPTFTGFFPSWDNKFWKAYKSFTKLRQDLEGKHATSNGKETNGYGQQKSGHSAFDQYDKYPLQILKEPNEKLPARVDPLNKELHLTHDDFVSAFNLTYMEFEKLPRWKQQEMKKKAGLF